MNSIIRLNKKQIDIVKKRLSINKKIFIAEAEGFYMQNEETFSCILQASFDMTKEAYYGCGEDNFRSCSEWMSDLDWLYEQGYSGFALVIRHYDLMLMFHPRQKRLAMEFLKYSLKKINVEKEDDDFYQNNNVSPFNIYIETPFVCPKRFSLDEAIKIYDCL